MINKLYGTDKPYYLILSERFLYGKAAHSYIRATLYRKPELDDIFFKTAVETRKSILWLRFDSSEENAQCETKLNRIDDSDSWIASYNIYGNELEDGMKILSPEKAAEMLPEIIARNERFMIKHGVFSAEIEDRCGNCHKIISIGDRYCRFCGTKRGEDKFQPEDNQTYCVYGPPLEIKYQCADCGTIFESSCLGLDASKYCPHCCSKKLETVSVIDILDSLFGDSALFSKNDNPSETMTEVPNDEHSTS